MAAIPRVSFEGLPPRYQVDGCVLGSGSYGCVCRAFDSTEKRDVAVKRVSHLFEDLIDTKRILREISILAQMQHKNVVQLHEVITVGSIDSFKKVYFVTELCDSDLRKLIKADVALSYEHVQMLTYNLLVGLSYVHSAGILHRDIKPANCLVNQDCCVKICDFGLSRTSESDTAWISSQNATTASKDQTGQEAHRLRRHLTGHVATRWYRAPELILLEDKYNESVDIWSAGCVVAELLGLLSSAFKGTMAMKHRGPLFPGASCFPLSPSKASQKQSARAEDANGQQDQLNVIFNILGTPTETFIKGLSRDDSRRYIRCFAPRTGVGLSACLAGAPKEPLNLLEQMLRLDARKRLTAAACLDHAYLREVRKREMETTKTTPVTLKFEAEPTMDELLLRDYFRDALNLVGQQATVHAKIEDAQASREAHRAYKGGA